MNFKLDFHPPHINEQSRGSTIHYLFLFDIFYLYIFNWKPVGCFWQAHTSNDKIRKRRRKLRTLLPMTALLSSRGCRKEVSGWCAGLAAMGTRVSGDPAADWTNLSRGLGLTDTSLHDPRPSCSVLTTSTYHEPLLPAPSTQGKQNRIPCI